MRRSPLAALFAFALIAVSAMGASRARAQELPECTNGLCSGHHPMYTDTAWVSWLGRRIAVGTQEPTSSVDYALTIYDLDTGIPPLNTNWDPAAGLMRRYHGPIDGSGFGIWRGDTLGTIFGLTLDNRGNIYVTATSAYYNDLVSLLPGATSGSVFKVDRTTGFVSVFANLPQAVDTAYPPGNDLPGLGNITYDPIHDVLFVTNMEDGKIYRLGMTGAITATFDPMAPDNGAPGWAPLGERLWGIQWHADNHLYYSRWSTDGRVVGLTTYNTIRSVALDGAGFFVPTSDIQVIQIPHISGVSPYSQPVSDISFAPNGHMFLAEHGMQNETYPSAHDSRLLEYVCTPPPGGWVPSGNTFLVGIYNVQNNTAGGVDVDYSPFTGGVPGRVWATGDAIHLSANDYIYGAQGLPPTGGSVTNSYLFDYNGIVTYIDKYEIGDIEIPCPSDSGSIHGMKFKDENCDGERNGTDAPIPGWPIVLSGPGGPYTTYTDAGGYYHFWNLPNGTYTVCELGAVGWTQTQPAGGCYTVTVANNTITNLNFGNCQHCAGQNSCIKAPANCVAWWPLDELAAPTAHDISGGNPGTWFGAPTPGGGKRGGALCFNGPAQYVRVNDSSQINFSSTADFSIDAWIKPSSVSGPQMIIDKRVPVGTNFRGYALGLQNNTLVFAIQDGTSSTPAYVSPAVIVANQWQHVTITVKRALNGGKAYLNGTLLGTFDPMATGAGSITNTSPLYIARNQSGSTGFAGCLDEIELFCRELSATEVSNLWSPGKCREWCSIPPVINFGPFQTTATCTFTICNSDWSQPSMTYSWSLNGLPAGSCSVNGPTVYSPSSGVLTIPAGTCQNVNVTITRPSWLTPGNTGCFVLNVSNTLTHSCFSCTGTVKATRRIWSDIIFDTVPLDANAKGTLQFIVHNGGQPGTQGQVAYRVDAVTGDDGGSADGSAPAPAVRLNGLPPGVPVTGTLSIIGGGTGVIGVPIEWGGPCSWTHIPDTFVKLSVMDDDPTGAYSDAASIRIRLSGDGTLEVSPPTSAPLVESVTAWPNPGHGGTHVRLSLPQASQVEAGVYDLAGRQVRQLHRGRMLAGSHDLFWDGMDADGNAAKAGLYFIRMRADDRSYGSRLVLIK